MDAKFLSRKSLKEIEQIIIDLKAELFTLRFKNSTGQLEQTHKIDMIKKDIARTLTIFNIKIRNGEKLEPKIKKVKTKKDNMKKNNNEEVK